MDQHGYPKLILVLLGSLLLFSLSAALFSSIQGSDSIEISEKVLEEKAIIIKKMGSKEAVLYDTEGKEILFSYEKGSGFVTAVYRAVQLERKKYKVSPDREVVVRRFGDNVYSIKDSYTGWEMSLSGFGKDNIKRFKDLFN